MARKKKQPVQPVKRWNSPIEGMLRNALCEQAMIDNLHEITLLDFSLCRAPAVVEVNNGVADGVEEHEDWGVPAGYHEYGNGAQVLRMYNSALIRGYKVDFLISECASDCLLAIECDGHEWHDRTKQQASSDRARDRELLRFGIPTIRFTGSDLHRSAEDCAREVIETFKAIEKRCYSNGMMDGHHVGYGTGRSQAEHEWATNDLARDHLGIVPGTLAEMG